MQKVFENAASLRGHLLNGMSTTLVGGCFDLLHVGHLHMLQFASTLEEQLVVAVLSDRNVREYKGTGRPVINQEDRALMVSSLWFVDYVYISDVNPNGPETLELLRPETIVFGGDVNPEKIVRWTENIAHYSAHTKIVTCPRYAEGDVSTSSIIDKIKNAQ